MGLAIRPRASMASAFAQELAAHRALSTSATSARPTPGRSWPTYASCWSTPSTRGLRSSAVAELPGVTEPNIRVDLKDDVLAIETLGERKYAKEIRYRQRPNPDRSSRPTRTGSELRLKKA